MKKREEFFTKLESCPWVGMYLQKLPNPALDSLFLWLPIHPSYHPLDVLTEQEISQVYLKPRLPEEMLSLKELFSPTLTIEGLINLTNIIKRDIRFYEQNRNTDYFDMTEAFLIYQANGYIQDDIERIRASINNCLPGLELVDFESGNPTMIKDRVASFGTVSPCYNQKLFKSGI